MKNHKWIGNQVTYVILFGIIGFLFAVNMFGGKSDDGNKTAYREIVLANKTQIIDAINKEDLKTLKDTLDKLTLAPPADDNKLKAAASVRKVYTDRFADNVDFQKGNKSAKDSMYLSVLLLNANELRDTIASDYWTADSSAGKQDSPLVKNVNLYYKIADPLLSKDARVTNYTGKLELRIQPSVMAFVSRNSMAGAWIIVSIAQMILWFLIFPLLYGNLKTVRNKVTNVQTGTLSTGNWIISCIMPLLFIGLFTYIFYWRMVDVLLIKNTYLLEDYTGKMWYYAVVGYSAAVACFGMFLHMSMALDQLDTAAKAGAPVAVGTPLWNDYDAIQKAFNGSFFGSALILSIFVLWVGITFSTINQSEAMRFYKIYSGKDFLQGDWVYLLGAFHTILLLLFYIPVKLKFNALNITNQAALATASPTPGNKLIGNIFNGITTLIVTSSPVIVAVLQKLLGSYFGN